MRSWLVYYLQTPAQPLIRGLGHLLWSRVCPLNRGFIVFFLSVASSLIFFVFTAHLITFCALHYEPGDFLDWYYMIIFDT